MRSILTLATFSLVALVLSVALAGPSDWSCYVVVRWHQNEKSGTASSTVVIDDASGKTDAEGKAIMRAQQKLKRVYGDGPGRRMTFSKSTAECEAD